MRIWNSFLFVICFFLFCRSTIAVAGAAAITVAAIAVAAITVAAITVVIEAPAGDHMRRLVGLVLPAPWAWVGRRGHRIVCF